MNRALVLLAAAAVASCSKSKAHDDGTVMLPGAPPVSHDLAARIEKAASIEKAARTEGAEAPPYTNRLVLEGSPYLRQHAHNPVDWRPWGDEAFGDARRLGRPILVSIGYSTCHWCHVMAEESFEDVEIATYMNQHYIVIKVDREERPDVDATYLKALEAMGAQTGWPLNVWLTPDGEPFFGATYVPPRDGERGVKSGFLTLLRRADDLVKRDREGVARDVARVAKGMRKLAETPPAGEELGAGELRRAVDLVGRAFDPHYGGVALRGQRNKFPADMPVRLLLRYARRTGDGEARRMAEVTLEQMAAGGIRDHLGGGFHRYATDPQWRVPHFEKMLYDNALLAVTYLEAYQATGREDFADVAREIFVGVWLDMSTEDNRSQIAALDADSRGANGRIGEGLYYTWTPDEVEAVLGPGDATNLVNAYYGVSKAGNFEGRSVLAIARPLGEVAAALKLDEARAREMLAGVRPRLLAARGARPRPHRDEKVIAGWNGLMISALVRASAAFTDDVYLDRATNLADALLTHLEGDRLPRVARGGASVPGTLEDYAFVMAGLLDLYEATADSRFREQALRLDGALARDLEDPAGGFFSTPAGGDPRLLREKPFEDGVLPSGNSVMALNLLRLAELTGKDSYRVRADRLLAAAAGAVAAEPAASPDLLLAVDWRTDVPLEIVLVAKGDREELAPFRAVLARTFLPNRVILAGTEAELAELAAAAPLVADKKAIGGRATAYVCLKGACKLPTRDPAVFEKQIRAVQPLP
ncbi:MAG TPA: thioredoxin domain-containing protein [Kofleriaceae bacterium]